MNEKQTGPQGPEERKLVLHTFEFPDRTVTACVIFCPHDNKGDTDFIIEKLKQIGVAGKTLFIEQGSDAMSDSIVNSLKKIASQRPEIAEDFEQRQKHARSLLTDKNSDPFSIAADFVLQSGGTAVNFDYNLSPEAIEFFKSNVPLPLVVELIYDVTLGVCYSLKDTSPKVIQEVLGMPLDELIPICDKLYEIYHQLRSSFKRADETRSFRNNIREKFMRLVLQKRLKEGDIVLAHPPHLKQVLLPESQFPAVALPRMIE